MQAPILVEPEVSFDQRQIHTQEDFFAFTAADRHVIELLRRGPMRLTTVLNVAARRMPARCKRHRLAIKHSVLLRLGQLVRQGKLQRIRRKLIALPA